MRDAHGTYVVQELLKVAHEGGGWVSYEWRGATEVSYVQEVKRTGSATVLVPATTLTQRKRQWLHWFVPG